MNPQSAQPVQDLTAACEDSLKVLGIPAQAVYLLGSWATPFEREDSDLDLALLVALPLDIDTRLSVEQEIRSRMKLPEQIDIIDLRQTDTIFAARAVTEGCRILMLDRGAADRFEMFALTRYARLNEERQGILADIFARGTIYKTGLSA